MTSWEHKPGVDTEDTCCAKGFESLVHEEQEGERAKGKSIVKGEVTQSGPAWSNQSGG